MKSWQWLLGADCITINVCTAIADLPTIYAVTKQNFCPALWAGAAIILLSISLIACEDDWMVNVVLHRVVCKFDWL